MDVFYSVGPLASEHPLISRCTKLTASQKILGLSKLGPSSLETFKMVGRKLFDGLLMFVTLGVRSPLASRCTKLAVS